MPIDKTTQYDSWQANGIKTLQDLFNFEANQLDAMRKKRMEITAAAGTAMEKVYRKELKDLEEGYKNVILKVRNEAIASVEERTNRRKLYYQQEFEEYKALLEKQARESNKQDAKSQAKFKKQNEKRLKDLQKAQKREAIAEETREANSAKRKKRQARDDLLEASKEQWGGAGGWKNSGSQMAASLSKSLEHGLKQIGKAFNDISNKINSTIDTFSKYQSSIDTRLQGTNKTFEQMQTTLKRGVGASPYLKTETMLTNLQTLVEAGIVSNVEQRAFLETIKDKIAATFDVANASLLRIIRLQQNDSTAARLGMEAYLTKMLNEWVKNTEYLSTTFDNVQAALIEASSIMTTRDSTAFEYIVQKWLGVLVGRGMAENTATSLAGALGMLGSGNVSGLSGNALNNLLVMAASKAGLDYADLLTEGLTAQNTNQLMNALVNYMKYINASGNKVVRSQYAQTFGLSISDLMAASGVTTEEQKTVFADMQDYSSLFNELSNQLNQVDKRTSFAEKVNNLFDNAQFSLASNIAGNAVMSAMWKVTDMIQGVTGGINIPMISAMGNAIDLETTVENLMKLGLVGLGSLGMIGDVITGLSNSGGNFSNTLGRLNISGTTSNDVTALAKNYVGYNDLKNNVQSRYNVATRGRGLGVAGRGETTSQTTSLVSNSSGEDIGDQTLNAAMDESKAQQADAAAEQDNPTADLRTYFLDVFDYKFNNLLAMVAASNNWQARASVVGNGIGMFNTVPLDEPVIISDRSVVRTTYAAGEDTEPMLNTISSNVATITELLSAVIDGSKQLKVKVASTEGPVPVSFEGGSSGIGTSLYDSGM